MIEAILLRLSIAFVCLCLGGAFAPAELRLEVGTNVFTGNIVSLAWPRKSVCLFLTDNNDVHISRDHGEHFELLTFNTSDPVRFRGLFVNPHRVRPAAIHLLDHEDNLHLSEDSGLSWEIVRVPSGLDGFKYMREVYHGRILASRISTSCSDVTGRQTLTCRQLYKSRDVGRTWSLLQEFVGDYAWDSVEYNSKRPLPPVRPEGYKHGVGFLGEVTRVTSLPKQHRTKNQSLTSWNPHYELVVRDSYSTVYTIRKTLGVNRFSRTSMHDLEASYMQENAKSGKIPVLQICTLQRNTGFEKLKLPGIGSKYDVVYRIIARDGMLPKCYNTSTESVSFDNWVLAATNEPRSSDSIETSRIVRVSTGYAVDTLFVNEETRDDCVQTFIKAGMMPWRSITTTLKPPRLCAQEFCRVHLHLSPTKALPRVRLTTMANVIVGIGNVGPCLSENISELSTFISKDSGVSWFPTGSGILSAAGGLSGGRLVLAETNETSSKLLILRYQSDEWEAYRHSDQFLRDVSFLAPRWDDDEYLYFTGKINNTKRQSSIVRVGPLGTRDRTCKWQGFEDSPDFHWVKIPSFFQVSNSTCYDGAEQYRRRVNSNNTCKVKLDHLADYKDKFCDCRQEDVVCCEGFARESPKGPCLLIGGNCSVHAMYKKCFLLPFGLRTVTTVPIYCRRFGNLCKGGVLLEHETSSCNCLPFVILNTLVVLSVTYCLIAMLLVLIRQAPKWLGYYEDAQTDLKQPLVSSCASDADAWVT